MKTCQYFCDKLSDFLDGEAEEHECRLIEEHLTECPPCHMLFESLKTTVDICGKGVTDEVPDAVRNRLKDFLREHCKTDKPRL
jgi:predicted anti-sigma-YlaC factor YlaD